MDRQISRSIKQKKLTILNTDRHITQFLVFLHVSKVATLTQVKTIYFQPYAFLCISTSQLVRNIGIAVFAGISVFACLRCLSFITSKYAFIVGSYP